MDASMCITKPQWVLPSSTVVVVIIIIVVGGGGVVVVNNIFNTFHTFE